MLRLFIFRFIREARECLRAREIERGENERWWRGWNFVAFVLETLSGIWWCCTRTAAEKDVTKNIDGLIQNIGCELSLSYPLLFIGLMVDDSGLNFCFSFVWDDHYHDNSKLIYFLIFQACQMIYWKCICITNFGKCQDTWKSIESFQHDHCCQAICIEDEALETFLRRYIVSCSSQHNK